MKRIAYIILLAALISPLITLKLKAQSAMTPDTVAMGPLYANEIYYSMKNRSVQVSPRNTWDIAFRTMKFSSSILTNDGYNVVLYTYPKSDTTGWATVDTSGFTSWKPMYNDPNDWENGAFSRNAKGHPDYGWCIYNDVTHDLVGDSLFVIKLRDGSLKKLWIIRKYSVQDIYKFRFANLDGSNEVTDTLHLANNLATDFVGFSIQTNQRVNFQPLTASWDILFTKYMSVQPDGSPYPVTGVIDNPELKAKRFYPVPLTYSDWQVNPWDSTKAPIGYNWKTYSSTASAYVMKDSLVFFVKPVSGDVYKLYFTSFVGTTTGVITFNKEKVFSFGVQDKPSSDISVAVYPNPANDFIHLYVNSNVAGDCRFVLSDLSGRQLGADHAQRLETGLNAASIDVRGLNPGVYFVTAITAGTKAVAKVIISR
jgi:hypothetical protein